MKKLLIAIGIGLIAGLMWSCNDSESTDEPEVERYQSQLCNYKDLTQAEADARGYLSLDYTSDPVEPIAADHVYLVDLKKQTRAEISLISPAVIEWMQCSKRCNYWFEPDTVFVGRDGGETDGKFFWIFYPHKGTMGNVSATFSEWGKLVIERTANREDYAVLFWLTRFNDLCGWDNLSIPTPVCVIAYQTPRGEAIARDWAISENPERP